MFELRIWNRQYLSKGNFLETVRAELVEACSSNPRDAHRFVRNFAALPFDGLRANGSHHKNFKLILAGSIIKFFTASFFAACLLLSIPLAAFAQLLPAPISTAQSQAESTPEPALTPAQAIENVAKLAQFQAEVMANIAPTPEATAQLESEFAGLKKQLASADEDFSLAPLPPLPADFQAIRPVLKARQVLQVELDIRKVSAQAATEPAGLPEPRTVDALVDLLQTLESAINQRARAREHDAVALSLEKLNSYLEQAETQLTLSPQNRAELQSQSAQTPALPKLDDVSALLSFTDIQGYVEQQKQAFDVFSARAQLRIADRTYDVESATRDRKLAQRHLQASDAAFIRASRRSELSATRLNKTERTESDSSRGTVQTDLRRLENSFIELQWLEDAERKQWLANTSWLRQKLSNFGQIWKDFSSTVGTVLNYGFFTVGETKITLGGIGRLLLIFLIAWFSSKWLRSGLARYGERLANTSRPALYSLGRVLHYVILALGLSIALSSIGLDLSKIAIFASALGVGIGFGLQTIVSNFISGLILLFERSLKLGDFVELASGVHGSVSDISIRATRITTNDNIDILVPNSEFINGQVTNWTLRDARRRIKIPFGVAYGSDKELVKRAALEAAASVPFTLATEGPNRAQVWLVAFGASSLDFKLVIWLTPDAVYRPGAVHAAYCWALDDALRKHEIEVPFPQMDVHLRSFFGANQELAQRRFHEPPKQSEIPEPIIETAAAPSTNDALEDALAASQLRQADALAAEDDCDDAIFERSPEREAQSISSSKLTE